MVNPSVSKMLSHIHPYSQLEVASAVAPERRRDKEEKERCNLNFLSPTVLLKPLVLVQNTEGLMLQEQPEPSLDVCVQRAGLRLSQSLME